LFRFILLSVSLQTIAAQASGAPPWRLDGAVGAPEWLSLAGESRVRYESLDGQFRLLRDGSDQILVFRTLLHARAEYGRATLGLEIHDARAYLDDEGTPISNGIVNTHDILQAYVRFRLSSAGTEPEQSYLKLGRFTLDIGSRRFVERNDFRNTINAFTGIHWHAHWADGKTLDAFYTAPVTKLPALPRKLADNEFKLDEERSRQRFWGAHLRYPDIFRGIQGELLIYGLHEEDTHDIPTPNRKVYAPGIRLYRQPAPGRWDLDLETAFRFGTRHRTALPADRETLDVRAHMLHAEVGYTFDNAWQLRLGLEYDVATGDSDPTDKRYERYERFFGTRRGDLGNTGIHGPLTRSNVSVPGIRVSFVRGRWDGRAHIQWPRLEAARDAWVAASLRDPTGRSGQKLGTTLDGRVRYWLVPGNLRLELGASALWFGAFARNVPGAPEGDRTLYGYGQATLYF
jgi:hypothetical protein